MREISQAVQDFRDSVETRRRVWQGWMVDFEGTGSARVSAEPGYVYVRIDRGLSGEQSGEVIKAYARIRPVVGWAVIVGTTPFRNWEYTVLDIDSEAMGGVADGDAILEPHHLTHEWGEPSGSDDVVYAREQQIYDFGVWPYSGLTVKINAGVYDPTGTLLRLEDTQVDLSGFVPSWGDLYCLITLSPTGTIEVVPGQPSGSLSFLDIPAAPSINHWELAAVRLRSGDTEIIHTPRNRNIVDLRWAKHGWAGKQFGGGGHDPVTLSAEAETLLSLTVQDIGLDQQPSGTVYAAPTGADGYPDFVTLVDSQIPDIHTHYPGTVDHGGLGGLSDDDHTQYILQDGTREFTEYVDIIERPIPANPAANTLRLYVEAIKGFSFFSFRDDTGMVRKIVRDSVFVAKNATGSTIALGRIVYASGSEDNVPTIALARADSTATMPAIGVTIELIADGNYGRVMQVGLLENVNTLAFSVGDIFYVSEVTAGLPTITPPTWPNIRQEIGTVLVDDAAVGAIQIVARSAFNDAVIDHSGLLNLDVDDHTQYMLNWDNVLIVHPAGATRTPGYYTTIQAAVNAASPGDTVLVMPGTYAEDIIINVANLTLRGVSREEVIITGGGGTGTLTITAADVYLANFTVTVNTGNSAQLGITVSTGASNAVADNVTCHVTGPTTAIGFSLLVATTFTLRGCKGWATAGSSGIGAYLTTAGATLNVFWCQFEGSSHADLTRAAGGTLNIAFTQYGTATGAVTLADSDEILKSLLTVDGAGSLLDADLLDGLDSSSDVTAGAAKILKSDGSGYLYLAGLGIGSATIPHGGVGWAVLAIEGPDSSNKGPHIQLTTATDDYPLLQIRGYSHDNVNLIFDAYWDGAWKSSDLGSNFLLSKGGDAFHVYRSTGVAQGGAVSWLPGITVPVAGGLGIGTTTVPHGGVGYGLLALDGSNASAVGPHIQFTTNSSNHPLMQILAWQTDSVQIIFDGYLASTGWISSDSGSSFKLMKNLDTFGFHYDVAPVGTALVWNPGLILTSTGKVGIGTSVVPHGGFGMAMLALDGPASSSLGPNIQTTVSTDDRPVFQLLSWSHDNMNLNLDCSYNGTWISSDAGSCYRIRKAADILRIDYDIRAVGSTIVWKNALSIRNTGRIGMGGVESPSSMLHIDNPSVAMPVLILDQGSAAQPFIEFLSGTIYTGKTAADEYLMVKNPSGATRYIRLHS